MLPPNETKEFLKYLVSHRPNAPVDNEKFHAMRMMLPKDNILISAARQGEYKEDATELEQYRNRKTAQFFRASAKAFELSQPRPESVLFKIKKFLDEEKDIVTTWEFKKLKKKEKMKSAAWQESQQHFLGRQTLTTAQKAEKTRLEKIIFTCSPWKLSSTTHSDFLTKTRKTLAEKIITPREEFVATFFRRGMELLRSDMGFNRMKKEWEALQKINIESSRNEIEKLYGIVEFVPQRIQSSDEANLKNKILKRKENLKN